PENSSSFSVSVVLPASGCEMMAKVRRRVYSGCACIGRPFGARSIRESGSSEPRPQRLAPALQRSQRIAGDLLLVPVRLPAVDAVDDDVVDEQDQRGEGPAGDVDLAAERERVGPEVADPVALDPARDDRVAGAGLARLQAGADPGLVLVGLQRRAGGKALD